MSRNFARTDSRLRTVVAIASAALLILANPSSTLAQRHPRGGGQSTGSAQPRGSHGDGGSGRQAGGATSGGSGQTQTRSGSGQSSGDEGAGRSSPRAVSRGRDRSDSGGSANGEQAAPARVRSGDNATRATGSEGGSSGIQAAQPRTRSRDGNATGRAVPREPGSRGGTTVLITDRGYYGGGFYPWGYGGLGFGGYYGGYYDPWWYDGYEPGYSYGDEGSLRLRMKPRDAAVYVDGYYAGRVDDFDGVFQRLRMESGPHRIEVRLDGFEPLLFEVRIQPDRTVTYKGDLAELP